MAYSPYVISLSKAYAPAVGTLLTDDDDHDDYYLH
jgi:hypothetical protein